MQTIDKEWIGQRVNKDYIYVEYRRDIDWIQTWYRLDYRLDIELLIYIDWI